MNIHAALLGLLICVFVSITWQDIRYRSVPLYLFVAAFITGLLLQYHTCGFDDSFLLQCMMNTMLLSAQLAIVWIYLRVIRNMKLTDALGMGDMLFYIILIPLLSTPVLMYIHLSSLLLILISYPFLKNALSLDTRAIPLAGMQAAYMVCLIIIFEYVISDKPITGTCSVLYWI